VKSINAEIALPPSAWRITAFEIGECPIDVGIEPHPGGRGGICTMNNIQPRLFLSIVFLLTVKIAACDGATFLGPSPYLSFADSPFAAQGFGYFYVENYEDGLGNVPGLITSQGIAKNPGSETDSVDADDGSIDGSGRDGHSFYPAKPSVGFRFDTFTLGVLPTHVGVVITDVGFPLGGTGTVGINDFTLEAFGPGDVSLGTVSATAFGDAALNGATPEDRFLGVIDSGGIDHVIIQVNSIDWELDHVQYGAVPEPGALIICGVGLLLTGIRRRLI
jgi:hypothetical protein